MTLPPPAAEAPRLSRRVPGLCLRGMEPQPSRSVPRPLGLQVSTFETPCLGRHAPTLQARSSGPRLLLIGVTVFLKIPDVPKGPSNGAGSQRIELSCLRPFGALDGGWEARSWG